MEVRNALETSVQQEQGQALAFTRIIKWKFFSPMLEDESTMS